VLAQITGAFTPLELIFQLMNDYEQTAEETVIEWRNALGFEHGGGTRSMCKAGSLSRNG